MFGREVIDFEEVGGDVDDGQGKEFDFLAAMEFDHPGASAINHYHLPWGCVGISGGELSILTGSTLHPLTNIASFDLPSDFGA